ncbi:MAG: AtpZ/AtpI family protein [Firmicutes bacterium]|nr:AtpZ/AtpI family protein [Bacillota bacterium]
MKPGDLASLGVAVKVALTIAGSLFLGLYLGNYVGRRVGSQPFFLIGGILVGLGAGFWQTFKILLKK